MADYSFLKPLFGADGSKAVTYDQFTEALDAQKEIKIGNLADGSYVAKGKFDAVVTERDTLKSGKEEADKKLAGYDPEWKTKAEAAQAEADAKVNAILLKNAALGALKGAGCKDPDLAFMALDASKLKLDGENVIGLRPPRRRTRPSMTSRGTRSRRSSTETSALRPALTAERRLAAATKRPSTRSTQTTPSTRNNARSVIKWLFLSTRRT